MKKDDLPEELRYLCVQQLNSGDWIGPDAESDIFLHGDLARFNQDFNRAIDLGLSFSYGYVMELGWIHNFLIIQRYCGLPQALVRHIHSYLNLEGCCGESPREAEDSLNWNRAGLSDTVRKRVEELHTRFIINQRREVNIKT
jgi:hypothetical protein